MAARARGAPHVLGMRGDERKGVDRAATAREEIDRTTDLPDDPMKVVGVLLWRRLGRRVPFVLRSAPRGS